MLIVLINLLTLWFSFSPAVEDPVSTFGTVEGTALSVSTAVTAAEEDPAKAYEKAHLLETVDGLYERALKAYQALLKREALDASIRDKAELGAARCLIRLGRKEEANGLLEGLRKRTPSAEAVDAFDQAAAFLEMQERANAGDESGSVSSLVIELLRGAGDPNKDRAKLAMREIEKMGSLAVPTLIREAKGLGYFESVASFTLLTDIGDADALGFLRSCTADPDPAVRKRCLDGILKADRTPKAMSLLIRFLGDEEDAFVIAAATSLQGDRLGRVPGDLPVMAERVGALLKSPDPQTRQIARGCLSTMLQEAKRQPIEGFPVDRLTPLVDDEFNAFLPVEEPIREEAERFVKTMEMATILYSNLGQEQYRQKISRFWFARVHGREGTLINYLTAAARGLPADVLDRLVQELIADENPVGRRRFGACCTPELFNRLPAETQRRFLDVWVRNLSGGISSTFCEDPESCLPSSWAAFVNAALENQVVSSRQILLDWIDGCPDTADPECLEVLSRWAVDPERGVQIHALRLLENMVEQGKIDPGRRGALQVLGKALALVDEPFRFVRVKEGEFQFLPDRARYALHVLPECIKQGEIEDVCAWIGSVTIPGFHDGVFGEGNTSYPILKRNREFALSLWPRLSPLAKEAFFRVIYSSLGKSLKNTKPGWILPTLRDLGFSRDWSLQNVQCLISVLNSLEEPELVPLVVDVTAYFFEESERFNYSSIGALGNVFKKLAPRSGTLRELVPVWYERVKPNIIKDYGPHVFELLSTSPGNLKQGLEWLAEGHGGHLEEKILEAVLRIGGSRPDLIRAVAAEEGLSLIWSRCGRETRASLAYALAGGRQYRFSAFAPLAESILLDEKVDPHVRHYVYAGLLYKGIGSAIDPLLKYLSHLEPGQAGRPLSEPYSGSADLVKATEWLLREAGHGYLRNFEGEPAQRLSREILTMEVHHPSLRYAAARALEIRNDQDLALALSILRNHDEELSCSILFGRTFRYLMRGTEPDGKTGDNALAPASAESRVAAKKLLARGLAGVESQNRIAGVTDSAISYVSRHAFTDLIPLVGLVALDDPNYTTRLKAVNCLGSFRNSESIRYLVECLKDPSSKVLEAAREYLRRMRDYEEQKKAWEAFMGTGTFGGTESPAASLIEMLKSDKPEVRLAAIKSLGKLGDATTLPALVKIIADGTPEERAAATIAVDTIAGSDGD